MKGMPPPLLSRRAFFCAAAAVQAGGAARTLPAAPPHLVRARALIRRGVLGRIDFCRAVEGPRGGAANALRFLLGGPGPLDPAHSTDGRATWRHSGWIASYERDPGHLGYTLAICGSRATLVVRPGGWRVFGQEA